MHKSPSVSIIILNWNGIRDTLECLESVYRIEYDNFFVVVLDNGSDDNSCIEIRNNYPQVYLIENDANLGFAEGNNIGIRYALANGADYIFLLNNDTIVDSQILTELLAAAQKKGDVGIFGSKIYYFYEPDKIWYSGAQWNNSDCQFYHLIDDITDVVETDYACGCAMFISKNTLATIGLMDPVLFLTYEETEWCFRALRLGVKSYCVPTAKVWHKISASFGGSTSPVLTYFMSRNLLIWTERNLSRNNHHRVIFSSLKKLVRLSLTDSKSSLFTITPIMILLVITKHLFCKSPSAPSRACYLGIRDYVFRQFGKCPEEVSKLI